MDPGVGVGLLERSLGWTRGALVGIRDEEGPRLTPCEEWTLGDLLVHMVDSLEVVAELAVGRVARIGPPPSSRRPEVLADHLRVLGCTLLDAWVHADLGRRVDVGVGVGRVDALLAAEVGALEIAVHGWDVAVARELPSRFPSLLAASLLPVAVARVPVDGRSGRFAPPLVPSGTDPATLLLAHLGRDALAGLRGGGGLSRVPAPRGGGGGRRPGPAAG